MINPYVTEFPADPKYFAGRGKELGEIKKSIDYTVHSEPVKSFTSEEIKEAIHLPLQRLKIDLEFDDAVIETIHTKTQGHPYFVLFFAHDILEYKQKGIITLKFFNAIYEKIFSHLAAARFIEDLTIASEREKEVLFKMAKLGEEGTI